MANLSIGYPSLVYDSMLNESVVTPYDGFTNELILKTILPGLFASYVTISITVIVRVL